MPDLIRDFGAVPGTDCTAALLAARDWCSTRPGSELVLRRGVYKLTSPLIFTACVSLVGWGGGHGDYSTRIECEGDGRVELGAGSTGATIVGMAIGGWASRIAGPALTMRVAATLSRVGVMSADVGLHLDGRTGNVNLVRVSGLTASGCGVGFWAGGNDANSFGVLSSTAVSCDVGWRTTAVFGGPSFVNCFAECSEGRGWDIQSGGGSVKLIGCYDESMLPAIVDDPSFMVGCQFYTHHISSGPPRVPASEIATIGVPAHLATVNGPPGNAPRVWGTIGDPQNQGTVGLDLYVDGDGTAAMQRLQLRCPFISGERADYWEAFVPAASAFRVRRSDGAHPRGTVQIPRLLVGGNPNGGALFAAGGAVDVAAKLAELEARISQLENA